MRSAATLGGKMRTAWTVVLLAACALCGCAETKCFKAGSTEQDFQRALAGCRVQAAMVPPSADRDWGSGLFDAWHCVADDRELHDSAGLDSEELKGPSASGRISAGVSFYFLLDAGIAFQDPLTHQPWV